MSGRPEQGPGPCRKPQTSCSSGTSRADSLFMTPLPPPAPARPRPRRPLSKALFFETPFSLVSLNCVSKNQSASPREALTVTGAASALCRAMCTRR